MSATALEGRSLDDVRRRNLSSVLSVIHREGPVLRSYITRQTGLSRSSVASLLGDLEGIGIVEQSLEGPSGVVGRPSPHVAATDRFLSVAVNPDVNGVRVALVSLSGQVVENRFIATHDAPAPEDASQIVARALASLTAARRDATLVGLCAAMPGRVSKDGMTVLNAPHLRWRGVPFADMLSEATGLSARVAFDSQVGLQAETLWGAARDVNDVVSFYGGPGGIGAAAMVDGRILNGASGAAARLGHIMVTTDGPTCICGSVGCFTTVVSQHQIAAAFGLRSPSATALREAVASETSPALKRFIEHQVDYLALAVRAAVFAYDPEEVLLGGFFEILLAAGREQLEAALTTNLMANNEPPVLRTPGLGDEQLVVGAGAAAFAAFLSDPLRLGRAFATA